MTLYNPGILIVDDEKDFVSGLARLIRTGLPEAEVLTSHSGMEGLQQLEQLNVGTVLLDLHMPGMDGMEFMQKALAMEPNLSIIVLTAHGTVETAVSALKGGAWDFLTKPVRKEELFSALAKGAERSRLLGENRRLREIMSRSGLERSLLGESPAMRRLKETIAAVASSNYTVLIRGESGTGKELVAESIHKLSQRATAPKLGLNCPAIPDQLLESELFGHVKGAFTGAERSHKGMFMSAARGTLILDEIGDISLPIQTKLLRVLQDGEVRPVGSSSSVKVDTRIVAITNQDLEQKIKLGTFREDLFYRLNVLTIQAPPLRERVEDIPLLAGHFMAQTCHEMQTATKYLGHDALACLCAKEWPGNVRELQNFVRRLAVFCPSNTVNLSHLRLVENSNPNSCGEIQDTHLAPYKTVKSKIVEDFTRRYLDRLLKHTKGNVSEAARISGLERVSLQKIIKRLDVDMKALRDASE